MNFREMEKTVLHLQKHTLIVSFEVTIPSLQENYSFITCDYLIYATVMSCHNIPPGNFSVIQNLSCTLPFKQTQRTI